MDIQVKAQNGEYDITISPGILQTAGEEAARLFSGRRAVLVSDRTVASLYMAIGSDSLKRSGFQVSNYIVPPGETSKSSKYLHILYDKFHEAGITRSDVVIALGGGVVGDLTGYAAATWLRGCCLLQIPTSLLAQVDSSIGGKTAINMPYGKNVIGTFYQPHRVLIDPDILSTLSERNYAEGMAEIIKTGCISDAALFDSLESGEYDLVEVIFRCIQIKRDIVEKDALDKGERMVLNFGHSLGHALEKLSGYEHMTHGEAVSIGMVYASLIGEEMGVTPKRTACRIADVLKSMKLPVSTDIGGERIFEAMLSDKKYLGDQIHFILLRKIGESDVFPLDPEAVRSLLTSVMERGRV